MASVREHMDHHDDPDDLPLVTESGRVSAVTALDADRSEAVRRAVASLLKELDRGDLIADSDPPRIDWDGVASILEADEAGRYSEALSTLRDRYDREYPSLLSIRIQEEAEPLDFVPGQYVAITYHKTPRPYSVASSPTRDHLEFCLRRVPGGRLTDDLFETLDAGDEVTIRGPNGDFVMEDPSTRDVAFLATGTGVAPLKSMIEYLYEDGQDVYEGVTRDIWLFLGSSWRDDLPYAETFRTLAEAHDNFHFVPTLSRESYLTDWDGETAYVQDTLMKYLDGDLECDLDRDLAEHLEEDPKTDIEARIDPANLEVYACGVSVMVETLVDTVAQVGVPDRHIHGEGYG